jgi:hypothetical protein
MKGPDQELEEFLSGQPLWRRKWLQLDIDTAPHEEVQLWLTGDSQPDMRARGQYEAILKRIPGKWHDYRRRWEQIALSSVPSGTPGRPRMDELAEEAAALHRAKKSYAQIATMLGEKYAIKTAKGVRKPTADSIRKLLKSRQNDSQPDKT